MALQPLPASMRLTRNARDPARVIGVHITQHALLALESQPWLFDPLRRVLTLSDGLIYRHTSVPARLTMSYFQTSN